MVREELLPDIGLKLLDSQRQPMIVRIDVQDHGFHALALLQNFGRMFDAARRNIGNVDKPIDSLFDFDERAEVGQIANTAGNHGTDGVTFRQSRPWIGLRSA